MKILEDARLKTPAQVRIVEFRDSDVEKVKVS